jgi:RHS repeat-associated protein
MQAVSRDTTGGASVGAEGGAVIIHRYYDPDTGRYLTPDPLAVVLPDHRDLVFGYSYANPLRYTDHTGLHPVPGNTEFEDGCEVHLAPSMEFWFDNTNCNGDAYKACRDAFPEHVSDDLDASCTTGPPPLRSDKSFATCKFCVVDVCSR